MLNQLDNFYLEKQEPIQHCLLALRKIIMAFDKNIVAAWKYGMPFFCYEGKMFCYLWIDKKTKRPYLGMVEGMWLKHPALQQGKRSRMKIILFDPEKDLPIKMIKELLQQAIDLYKNGMIATAEK